MSVTIQHEVAGLDALIRQHLERPVSKPGQQICSETIRLYGEELKSSYGIKSPVFLSGHQPIFYHPGILAKDYLVQALARRHGGTAVSLILDTDQESISFSWPGAGKRSIILSDANRILADQRLNPARKEQLLQSIDQALIDLSAALTPLAAQRARPYLFHLRQAVKKNDDITAITGSVREYHAERLGWKIVFLRASDLIKTRAFRFFAAEVCRRHEEFRDVFNSTLAEYRHKHGIKNHAQPFPDLKEFELPFWYSLYGVRRPLQVQEIMDAGLPEAGKESPGFDALFEHRHVLPRAITLSLFLRLFICDLFVHGTGGGRYDRITEKVIERFFHCHAAPITVATATLHLEARADFALHSRTRKELHEEERRLNFDPVRFLPESCPLQQERKVLIYLREHLSGPDLHYALPLPDLQKVRPSFASHILRLADRLKDPAMNPPALLHREFVALRRRAAPYLKQRRKMLETEIERERRCAENLKLFNDRSFPFFFYDLTEIEEAVRPYAIPYSSNPPCAVHRRRPMRERL
jgi:hypothetical protein